MCHDVVELVADAGLLDESSSPFFIAYHLKWTETCGMANIKLGAPLMPNVVLPQQPTCSMPKNC